MELKKKYKELIALYVLERELCDLFVEGNIDKVFFNYYLKSLKKIKKIIPIEEIDFSELPVESNLGLDIHSNKNKLIILSKLISDKIPNSRIKCIVDKDFDDFLPSISNNNLIKTDYSCLEAYLFCDEVIQKFLDIGIGNFPKTSTNVLRELAKVLKPLFCIRLIREQKFKNAQLIILDGNLNVNKVEATINFDINDYWKKFLMKNGLTSQKVEVMTTYDQINKNLTLDIRNYIHGHDFIDVFYLYINKVKNTNNFRPENIGRALFLTVEVTMLDQYNLFQNIQQ